MIEFFQNIWNWIVFNKEGILTFFTSSNFVAICVTIFTIVKQTRANNRNTESLNAVKNGLNSTSDINNNVSEIKEISNTTNDTVNEIVNKENNIERSLNEFIETTNAKINAMLEVQSLVYSTIKDDTIRNSVNSIIIDAKHCEANAKSKLQAEIDELKSKLTDNANKIAEEVAETIDKVQDVIAGADKNEHGVRRY